MPASPAAMATLNDRASLDVRRGPREKRIDILRGLAMIIIVINHITVAFRIYGLQGVSIPTPSAMGYSTSASLFVIMSGYMVGMVYLQKPSPTRAILLRARKLYIYNVALIIAVAPIMLMMQKWEFIAWDAGFFLGNPILGAVEFLTLVRAPALLDILQLYVIFMLLTPPAVWVYRKSAKWLGALSVTLWLLSQAATATGVLDPKLVEWKFNPAAWQLLFFIPLIFGAQRAHEKLFAVLESRRWITLVVGAVTAVFALARLRHLEYHIPHTLFFTSKGNLGVLHLIHACLVIVFYCGLLSLSPKLLRLPPMRGLACVGRQTLYCYVVSVWVTYASAMAWSRLGGGYFGYLATALLALVIAFVTASLFDARSARRAPLSSRLYS